MKNSFAVKLDPELLRAVKAFCDDKGYKQNAFVEMALKNQMEQEEFKDDLFDLMTLRNQEALARPLAAYHAGRRK